MAAYYCGVDNTVTGDESCNPAEWVRHRTFIVDDCRDVFDRGSPYILRASTRVWSYD